MSYIAVPVILESICHCLNQGKLIKNIVTHIRHQDHCPPHGAIKPEGLETLLHVLIEPMKVQAIEYSMEREEM